MFEENTIGQADALLCCYVFVTIPIHLNTIDVLDLKSSSLIKQSVNPQPIDRVNALKTSLLNGEEDSFKK